MGTISDKLTYLDETRENIRQSINSIGGSLTNSDTFRSYSDAIDEIYEKFPKVEGEGSNITLENTMEASIKSELNGDTSQDGTPTPDSPQPVNVVSGGQEIDVVGKNLFDKTIVDWYRNNNGVFYDATNNNTTRIRSTSFLIKGGKTYTLSGLPSEVSLLSVRAFDTNKTRLNDVSITNNTFTLSSEVAYIHLLCGGSNFTDDTNILMKNANIQIEVGSTATEYEEYKGQSYEINLGKNLFDKDTLQQGGLDLGGSGIETANPARTRSDFIEVQPNTSYVISHIDTIIYQCGIGLYKNDNSYDTSHKINNGAWNNFPYTFTTQSDTKYVRLSFRNADSTNITPDLDYQIQLEKGTQSTNWVQYKTPIEVCKINTYKDMIFRSKGVNLFDKDTMLLNMYFDVGTMTLKSSSQTYIAYAKVPKNTNITISKTSITNRFRIGFCDTIPELNSSFVRSNVWENDTQTLSVTINSGNYEYVLVQYTNSGQNTDIQINEGSTALPYEPYNSKGKWLLHKEIGKVVLNGSESWNSTPTNTTGKDRFYTTIISSSILKPSSTSTLPDLLCNRYIPKTVNQTYTCNTGVSVDGYGNVIIYDENKATGSANDYKTWVSTHNTIVYYILATPTTTEITDSELIEQLAEFGDAKSYEGTTNINVDGDLPIILNVKALEDIFSQ